VLMRTSVPPGRHQDRSRADSAVSCSQVSSQARSQSSCHAQLPILVVISAPEPPIWTAPKARQKPVVAYAELDDLASDS
jgi:hypothetical protein